MAYWGKSSLSSQISPPEIFKLGDGVNQSVSSFEISKSEAFESINTSNNVNYPSLSTRKGLESQYNTSSSPLSNINAVTSRAGNTFYIASGLSLLYWNGSSFVTITNSLSNVTGKFVEFTTATKKYTIYFNGFERKYWDGSTLLDITDVNCPLTKIFTTNDRNLFALIGSNIYTSDTGDITNWTTGDADRIGLTGMIGDGTCIIAYSDSIIAFSDRTMHIVLGKNPDEFSVSEPIPCGNISQKSTLVHGNSGILYWVDYNRIMAFSSGLPYEVSQKIEGYLKRINYTYKDKIRMSQSGKYLYISFPIDNSSVNNCTIEYDTEKNMWYPWNKGFTEFFSIGIDLFGINNNGIVYKLNTGFNDDNALIEWEHTTGVLEFLPLKNLKHITDMYIIVDLPIDSVLHIKYSTSIDSNDFQDLKSITANENEQNARIRIPTTKLQRLKWFRFKFSGIGKCTIHYVELHGRRGV